MGGDPDRSGPDWAARKVATNGVVCASWQQVTVGVHRAGERCDVLVGPTHCSPESATGYCAASPPAPSATSDPYEVP